MVIEEGKKMGIKDLNWKMWIMIMTILIAASVAGYYGANVTVNLNIQARLEDLELQQQILDDTINIPINSTISGMLKTCSYIISFHDPYYCIINGTDDRAGRLEFYSTNKTLVEQFALGNLTSGTVYLKQVQHNSSLTVPANVLVIEDYQGLLTYRTATMAQHIPACPTNVSSTFTLTNDTSEHTIVTLTPSSVMQMTNFYLDLSALTQNCTLRVYLKIDGVNYVELTGMTVTVAAGSKGMPLKDHVIDTDWKVTIQSAVAEGASRDIDYRYFVNVY